MEDKWSIQKWNIKEIEGQLEITGSELNREAMVGEWGKYRDKVHGHRSTK